MFIEGKLSVNEYAGLFWIRFLPFHIKFSSGDNEHNINGSIVANLKSAGISEPTVKCEAGYFCKSGAKTPTPTQDSNANICPRGSYCLEETSTPTPCPSVSLSGLICKFFANINNYLFLY